MLGDSRVEVKCADGTTRICLIRGKMVKRVWINTGDVILVGLREFDNGKADVIHKYSPFEAKSLHAYGELPDSLVSITRDDEAEVGNNGLKFVSYSDDEDDEDRPKSASPPQETDWNKMLEEL